MDKTFAHNGHQWTIEHSEPMKSERPSEDATVLIASVQLRGKKQLMAFAHGKLGFKAISWNSTLINDGVSFRKMRDSLTEGVITDFEDYLEKLPW